ncbi:MAG: hypothetical protein D0531_05290 [Methylococcales bacterium]|nr:MAG: hypothetical protein D0531_05290 [Methylococcales bacterium]
MTAIGAYSLLDAGHARLRRHRIEGNNNPVVGRGEVIAVDALERVGPVGSVVGKGDDAERQSGAGAARRGQRVLVGVGGGQAGGHVARRGAEGVRVRSGAGAVGEADVLADGRNANRSGSRVAVGSLNKELSVRVRDDVGSHRSGSVHVTNAREVVRPNGALVRHRQVFAAGKDADHATSGGGIGRGGAVGADLTDVARRKLRHWITRENLRVGRVGGRNRKLHLLIGRGRTGPRILRKTERRVCIRHDGFSFIKGGSIIAHRGDGKPGDN